METKTCTKCNETKPITDYYQVTNKKLGTTYRYNYCKKCHYKQSKPTQKKWREENPNRWYQLVRSAQKAYDERQPSGIYLITTKKGLYVGQTDSFGRRKKEHKLSSNKNSATYKGDGIISMVLIEEVPDRKLRQERETYWIQTLQPELNVRKKKKK